VNKEAGSRRLFSHSIFTPGSRLARAARAGLAAQAGVVQGLHDRRQHAQELSKYPWRMDDEKVAYKGYEMW
jgi:hypothetical protein